MSRNSEARRSKNPFAWSRGPPQPSSSSRSSAPSNSAPRPSALADVLIKDGGSVNRHGSSVAKQGFAVSFGSIDDISAPISSSPTTIPSIKSDRIKSFGTIDAGIHLTDGPFVSSAAVPTPPLTTNSSPPSPPVSRADIAKLFANTTPDAWHNYHQALHGVSLGAPHWSPHVGIPTSPRNPAIPFQGGTEMPMMANATALSVQPISYSLSSMNSISLSPRTPSTSPSKDIKSSFVPARPKVVIKKADGTIVSIEELKANPPGSKKSQRGGQSMRLDTPEQRKKRLAVEEQAKPEKLKWEKEVHERKREKDGEKRRLEEEKENERIWKEKEANELAMGVGGEQSGRRRPEGKPITGDATKAQQEEDNKSPEALDSASSPRNDSEVQIKEPFRPAFSTAQKIRDLNRVPYPEGISGPNPELNTNPMNGKFRYDRAFLLQFMAICKEKPNILPLLDATIGLKRIDQSSPAIQRGGSDSDRQTTSSSAACIINPDFRPSKSNPFTKLNPLAVAEMSKMTSEERFRIFTGRPASVTPGGTPGNRTRRKRGKQRDDDKTIIQGAASVDVAAPVDPGPAASSKNSAGPWDRTLLQADADLSSVIVREVRSLLNKLTMERFDSISDQILELVNKLEKEGRALIQVTRMVVEQAMDEFVWSEMYARLCRKMTERISNKVQDDFLKNKQGKPVVGGQLFRKYLLNSCQENFERGLLTDEKDKEKKRANGRITLSSDENHVVQWAKRQRLGYIKFVGELFKLQMLTQRIMHEHVQKLLDPMNDIHREERIESLCHLLTMVGSLLDIQKARKHMDIYLLRMRELMKDPNISLRTQFMLQDVIDLRDRKWAARDVVAASTTSVQIREAAAEEKIEGGPTMLVMNGGRDW